jgi:hypothetical protein
MSLREVPDEPVLCDCLLMIAHERSSGAEDFQILRPIA